MPNPKIVPGPVRAWVRCFKGQSPMESIAASLDVGAHATVDAVPIGDSIAETHAPVLILDPRTHRAVPLKRKGRK